MPAPATYPDPFTRTMLTIAATASNVRLLPARAGDAAGPRVAQHAPATRPARYCPGFATVTVMSGFILRKLFSPTPLTFIRSSTFLKPPFFCR